MTQVFSGVFVVDVGQHNTTQYTENSLEPDTTDYLIMTAYGQLGNKSGFSHEISRTAS